MRSARPRPNLSHSDFFFFSFLFGFFVSLFFIWHSTLLSISLSFLFASPYLLIVSLLFGEAERFFLGRLRCRHRPADSSSFLKNKCQSFHSLIECMMEIREHRTRIRDRIGNSSFRRFSWLIICFEDALLLVQVLSKDECPCLVSTCGDPGDEAHSIWCHKRTNGHQRASNAPSQLTPVARRMSTLHPLPMTSPRSQFNRSETILGLNQSIMEEEEEVGGGGGGFEGGNCCNGEAERSLRDETRPCQHQLHLEMSVKVTHFMRLHLRTSH